MKALWLLGLLKRVGKSGYIVPSDRAAAYVAEAQLSSEPLRWRAIVELHPEMEKIWEDYEAAYKTDKTLKKPPTRLPTKMIDDRVAAMQGRKS